MKRMSCLIGCVCAIALFVQTALAAPTVRRHVFAEGTARPTDGSRPVVWLVDVELLPDGLDATLDTRDVYGPEVWTRVTHLETQFRCLTMHRGKLVMLFDDGQRWGSSSKDQPL